QDDQARSRRSGGAAHHALRARRHNAQAPGSAQPQARGRTPMKKTLRGKQTVTIRAPRAQIWRYAMDLAKVPEYNPRVAPVESGSGDGQRAAGVRYRCHLLGDADHCTEEDVEIVPME